MAEKQRLIIDELTQHNPGTKQTQTKGIILVKMRKCREKIAIQVDLIEHAEIKTKNSGSTRKS